MPFTIPNTLVIDDGVYPAVFEGVTEEQGQFGLMRKWTFLVEHAVDGVTKVDAITQITSGNTGPQSKSYQWLTALLGRAPAAGEEIDDPTGTKCLVTIAHNEKGFPKVTQVSPVVEPQQTLPGIPR